eukprot:5029040-Pyramimonas_sp.AAC.1
MKAICPDSASPPCSRTRRSTQKAMRHEFRNFATMHLGATPRAVCEVSLSLSAPLPVCLVIS